MEPIPRSRECSDEMKHAGFHALCLALTWVANLKVGSKMNTTLLYGAHGCTISDIKVCDIHNTNWVVSAQVDQN